MWEHLCVDPQHDPEARIRELERPLSETARESEMTAAKRGGYDKYPPNAPPVTCGATSPSTPRKNSGVPALWIVGAVSTVMVLVLGGLAVLYASQHSHGGSTSGVPSNGTSSNGPSSTTTTTTQANPSLQTLYRVVPPGYGSTNCAPAADPSPHARATVECGQTSDPQGPLSARFSIYPSAPALANAFQGGVDEESITQCPGRIPSPSVWHTDAAPDVPAGSLLCGMYNGVPDLMWTENDGLLIGDIQGPDLNALYQFWQNGAQARAR
jgi:serine/threonine kinase PknH